MKLSNFSRHAARSNCSRGQAMVEMALCAPILVLLLLAVSDFARLFFLNVEVHDAARAGVQYGAQDAASVVDTAGMKQAALSNGSDIPGLTATANEVCQCPSGSAYTCGTTPGCGDPRNYAQVTAQATFTTLLNYPGIPHSVTISATEMMRAK